MEMPVTQRKIKPGKALGVGRCCRIATDDTTPPRFDFSRAAKAVALSGVLAALRPLTGSKDLLSRSRLPKTPLRAIPGASIYEVMT